MNMVVLHQYPMNRVVINSVTMFLHLFFIVRRLIGDKYTNKREQCQIYLSIAEREYIGRSQIYE